MIQNLQNNFSSTSNTGIIDTLCHPEGQLTLSFDRNMIKDVNSENQIFQCINGQLFFELIFKNGIFTFIHSSPGTRTQDVKIDSTKLSKDMLNVQMEWSPQEIQISITETACPTNKISKTGQPHDYQIYISHNGNVGRRLITSSGMVAAVQMMGNQGSIIDESAIDAWTDTIQAIGDLISSNHINQIDFRLKHVFLEHVSSNSGWFL